MMAPAACHRACRDERFEDGLLRGIGHGLEEEVHAVLSEDAEIHESGFLVMRQDVAGCEAERDIAAAMTPEGAQSRQPNARAADDPLELPIAQWDVRSGNDDDGAFLRGSLVCGSH